MILKWFKKNRTVEFDSIINGKIKVSYLNGHPRVEAGGLLQSGSIIKQLWQKPLDKLRKLQFYPQNILILGLGGGTIIQLIRKRYPEVKIIAVEIDPKMIEIANKHFKIMKEENQQLICADAFSFLQTTNKKYDLILVDLFSANEIPQQMFDKIFWELLEEKGTVSIINTLFFDNYRSKSQQLVEIAKQITKNILLMRNLSNLFIFLNPNQVKNNL